MCSRCCYCQPFEPFERDIIHIKLSFSGWSAVCLNSNAISSLLLLLNDSERHSCVELILNCAPQMKCSTVQFSFDAENAISLLHLRLKCVKSIDFLSCWHSINSMHVGHVSQLLFWFFPTQKHTRSEFHSELRWLDWKIVVFTSLFLPQTSTFSFDERKVLHE